MKVLVVEDEAQLADVIARNLRARGHDARVEACAEDALLWFAESRPDVVVLDVNLPDLTGWEILRRLSASDRDGLRVVIISAAPISEKRIAEFAPDAALQKPFPIDALVRAVTGAPAVDAVAIVGEEA